MIGVLIATHGNLAEEILKSAELIVGKQDKTMTLGLQHGDCIESFIEKVKKAILSLNEGDGVIVFVDLFGASPYNAAAFSTKDMCENDFKCITGVNLPMLLEALTMRDEYNLHSLTSNCINEGKLGVKELFNEMNLVRLF